MSHPVFAVLLWLGLLLGHFPAEANPPIDYGRYLEKRDIGELRPMRIAIPAGDGTSSPLYEGEDKHGNRFMVLIVGSQAGVHERLGLSQMAQVFGLPRDALWPLLVDSPRGYFVGLAAPRPKEEKQFLVFDSSMDLTPQATADVFTSLAFTYLFGARGYGCPLHYQGQVIHTSPHLPFEDFADPKRKPGLRAKLESLEKSGRDSSVRPALMKLARDGSAADISAFQQIINNFLSRVESSLASGPGNDISTFDKLLQPMVEYGPWAQKAVILSKTKEAAATLRKETLAYLRQINPALTANFPEPFKFMLRPRTFDQAKFVIPWGATLPTLGPNWEIRAKDYLWNYILSSTAVREKLKLKWAEELQVTDPITAILNKATIYDSRLFLADKETHDIAIRSTRHDRPQFQINDRIKRGLVVVAPNDQEGRSIQALAEQLSDYFEARGAEQLRVFPKLREFRNGEELTYADFTQILSYAVTHKFTTLIVCELGGLNDKMRKELAAKGIEAIELDHHNTLDKRSTLEQFADLYNYHLFYNDFITAMLDKGGIAALAAMGITKSELRTYLEHTGQMKRIDAILESPWAIGPKKQTLYRIDGGDGPIGEYGRALGYLHYPETPSFLIWNEQSVRFAGPHSVCRDLKQEMEARFPGKWVTGGDLNRGFFIFRPDRSSGHPRDLAAIFEARTRELRPYSCFHTLAAGEFHRVEAN